MHLNLDAVSCTDSLVVKDPISDAGGPRFESHAGRVTGKPTPSLWRDKHPAIKGLRPPEHHAGKFRQDQKDSSESKKGFRAEDPAASSPQQEGAIALSGTLSGGALFAS